MARKLKFSPKINMPGPGLFDLDGDIAPSTPIPTPEATPIPDLNDPGLAGLDFTINIKAPGQQNRPSAEIDRIAIDTARLNATDSILFMSFGSGSSGNCSYIGGRTGGFLIDAGVDIDKVRDGLKANGLSLDHIKGVCLTHDHSDHVRYVYSLVRKRPSIGGYCTPKTLSGIMRRHSISRRLKDYHRPIYKEFAFQIGEFEITAFDVSHDGTDNSGFFIRHGDNTMAVATDLGHISPRVDYYMRQARYIVIESNYDSDMLATGPYPMHLKARIAADNGHMDNAATARFLAEIASPRLTHIFLCHLSQDNNTPDLALTAIREALLQSGITAIGDCSGSLEARKCPMQLMVLPRFDATPLITLRHE